MTDRTRVGIGRAMAAIAVPSAIVGFIWLVALGYRGALWEDWVVHNGLIAVSAGIIVWLVLPSQPGNIAVWLLAWSSLLTGLLVITYAIVGQYLASAVENIGFFSLVPAELPTWVALVAMQANWLWVGIFLLLAVLHVFPDGRTRGGWWRGLFLINLGVIALIAFGMFWQARPASTLTLRQTQDTHGGFESGLAGIVTIGYPLCFALGAVGVAAMVLRYRESVGAERQQFRWVVWGAAVTGFTTVAAVVVDEVFDRTDIALVAGAIGFTSLVVSIGIAIGKYRLYDIDAVISRTLVYGILALFIGVVYVAIAVLPWVILGSDAQSNTWLGIVATMVVAVSFQPMRRRLERLANRVVYGRRATPYEVLSSFSQCISAVDPDVLGQVAKSLAEGTTAESASIWVGSNESMHCIAAWPAEPDGLDPTSVSAPVVHDGAELGHVALQIPPGQPFPETDQRLLDQVAAGLGLALRNMQLTEDLRDRVDELAASRRRIVTVQDETRRKLERDLHDGAQQRLVALKIKLGIGSSVAEKAGLDDVKTIIDTVREETDHTIDSVRDFARGIYPPLLEAEGLGQALNAQARKMPIPVTVQAAGLERYTKEQEATVYFCVLEALQNAMKHSEASSVQVVLRDRDGELMFEVCDDGVGFDLDAAGGSGLVNVVDRVEAVDGTLDVVSAPGQGTTITGSFPVVIGVPA